MISYILLPHPDQLTSIKKDRDSPSRKENYIRKLSDIHRELPKYIDRASYLEGIFKISSLKYYINFPLLLSELDV
jgi:hypothetical protein